MTVLTIPLSQITLSTGPPASISSVVNDSVWSQLASTVHRAHETSNGMAFCLGMRDIYYITLLVPLLFYII